MPIEKLTLPDRPHSISLTDAIERCIDEIAVGKMTPYEVLGVIDAVSKKFYEENISLSMIKNSY